MWDNCTTEYWYNAQRQRNFNYKQGLYQQICYSTQQQHNPFYDLYMQAVHAYKPLTNKENSMDITIKKCDCCGKEARSDRKEDKDVYDGFAMLKLIFNEASNKESFTNVYLASGHMVNTQVNSLDENPKYSRKIMTANVCESCIYDFGLAQKKEEVKEPDTCGLLKGLKKIFKG